MPFSVCPGAAAGEPGQGGVGGVRHLGTHVHPYHRHVAGSSELDAPHRQVHAMLLS